MNYKPQTIWVGGPPSFYIAPINDDILLQFSVKEVSTRLRESRRGRKVTAICEVADFVKNNSPISAKQIADRMPRNVDTVRLQLKHLFLWGLIRVADRPAGTGKTLFYKA